LGLRKARGVVVAGTLEEGEDRSTPSVGVGRTCTEMAGKYDHIEIGDEGRSLVSLPMQLSPTLTRMQQSMRGD